MVRKIRSREVPTEEESLNSALEDEGMNEFDDMSLEEKRQLLQAIKDSKNQSMHMVDAPKDGAVVSSTTLEKNKGDNIVVQIDDSNESTECSDFSSKENRKAADQSSGFQSYNSYEDVPQSPATSPKKTETQLVEKTAPSPSEFEQFQILSSGMNILDHQVEPSQEVALSCEVHLKAQQKLKAECNRVPWYFDAKLGISKEEHFCAVNREMEKLTEKSARQELSNLQFLMRFTKNGDCYNREIPIYELLPYGFIPKEVPYSEVIPKDKQTYAKKRRLSESEDNRSNDDSDDDFKSPKAKKVSSPKKIVIKPRLINLEDENVNKVKPGPSNETNFSPVKEMEEDDDIVVEGSQSPQVQPLVPDDLLDCPLCFCKFDKFEIEAHFDLCDRSSNTELVDGRCPFCHIELPGEFLREKHMSKCLSKQAAHGIVPSIQTMFSNDKPVNNLNDSRSDDSDLSDACEETMVEKKCLENL
ncbi:uncharacterized protein LOC132203714 [Neocloeon triangulifer]|uniref:uncharacterized protein LOC132203714 n=1 Tax=Neocloeon triangulifer TaxID=2078957 RepID=UPI00286F150F|nr:uncharacterized protein LOC132203714 [Neocloeon triangulifer]